MGFPKPPIGVVAAMREIDDLRARFCALSPEDQAKTRAALRREGRWWILSLLNDPEVRYSILYEEDI